MRIVADSGLWSTGPSVSTAPALAVLEVAGAVLAWTADDPAGAAATRITFTDIAAAEWLWRILGPGGHVAAVTALERKAVEGTVELPGIEPAAGPLAPLRRLGIGHWARRWWPVSPRDGIVGLDSALLDAEIALLTAAAQEYLAEDTLDLDVAELLRPHHAALLRHRAGGDPRVVAVVDACSELAHEVGAWGAEPPATLDAPTRRADYALAAGAAPSRTSTVAVASGVESVDWVAVPPGVFDAADQTVEWLVECLDSATVATVQVAMTGDSYASGIAVRLRSGPLHGAGVLDPDGVARIELVDAGRQPVTEHVAWNHDWSSTTVTVGGDVSRSPEATEVRWRIRDFARSRLARPGADAFLAEILAAESDY